MTDTTATSTNRDPAEIERDIRRTQDEMSRTVDRLGDQLTALMDGASTKVVLNLTTLDYVSSAGLRVILRAAKLLQGHGGAMAICGASGMVDEVLKSSGFDSLLKMFASEKDAIAALG